MYVDSSDLNSPVAMETDIPLIEDVQRLKKTVEEGATQVNLTFSLSLLIFPVRLYINTFVCSQACKVSGLSFLHDSKNSCLVCD